MNIEQFFEYQRDYLNNTITNVVNGISNEYSDKYISLPNNMKYSSWMSLPDTSLGIFMDGSIDKIIYMYGTNIKYTNSEKMIRNYGKKLTLVKSDNFEDFKAKCEEIELNIRKKQKIDEIKFVGKTTPIEMKLKDSGWDCVILPTKLKSFCQFIVYGDEYHFEYNLFELDLRKCKDVQKIMNMDLSTIEKIEENLRPYMNTQLHKSNLGKLNDIHLNILEGIEKISTSMFTYKGIESLHLPSTLKKLQYGVFTRCWKLKEVTFKEGIEFIDNNAFYGCYNLKNINVPKSVKKLGIFNL